MKISRRQTLKLFTLAMLGPFQAKPFNHKDLPRIFIIGDSISLGYTPFVVKSLKGKALVSRPNQNCNGTKLGVEKLDDWLGNEKYDLIHFNFGLHDMKHVDPVTGVGSINPSNPRQSDLPIYKRNLEAIVKKLKATGAMIIFATSTPVVGELAKDVLREPEELTKYNRAATKIMHRNHIRVNDLFSFAKSLVKEYQIPNDVHFTEAGYAILGQKVSEVIAAALRI
jgi:hypothetical protein